MSPVGNEAAGHLLVPHEVGPDRAEVWVGLVDAPATGLRVAVGNRVVSLPSGWQRFAAGGRTLLARRAVVDRLSPRRTYPVRLLRGAQAVAGATVTTLPERLPTPAERPFTVLTGSCFCAAQDPGGLAGAAVRQLPAQARPDVTIVSGDQVYLDSPALHFLACTHRPDELAGELLASYLATWGQRTPGGGYREVLSAGATYFSSDDHELWNNAPEPTPYVRDSWTASGRAAWLRLGRELYHIFQAAAGGSRFAIGQLSFLVADTRLARTADLSTLIDPRELASLAGWVGGLRGPGVLVVGQPLFAEESGWRGALTDRSLADFRQYHELVAALAGSRHDIVVLTGDVHFGRLATCQLPGGARIIELIASPFALVDPIATGKWKPAPATFPAAPRRGGPRFPVATHGYRRADEHFLTLAFSGAGPAVRLAATSWTIAPGGPPVGRVIGTLDLH